MRNIFALNINEINKAIDSLNYNPEVKSIMILQSDTMHPSYEEMDALLKKSTKKIIGGLFPEIIVKGKQIAEGTLLMPFPFDITIFLFDFEKVFLDEKELNKILKDNFEKQDFSNHNLLLFIDAFAEKKSEYINALYNFFGISVNYLGGGAGSLKSENLPCIFTNSGVSKNAAVIGMMKNKISIGVSHGWRAISDSLKVTEIYKNRILSLDWRPAFEVYKEIIEKHSDFKFNGSNFSNILKSYPIGMVKLDSEMIIRDVLSVSENDLLLLDNIEEGDYINIMHGDINSLLISAKNAKLQSDDSEIIDTEHQDFCIDCITRAYYLKDRFKDELDLIKGSSELNGILSLGEIANQGESFLEIYNKTIVVSRWKTKS